MTEAKPLLMFCGPHGGQAEEAITFYVSLIKNSRIISIDRYGVNDLKPEGTVKVAYFVLAGSEYVAIDSTKAHDFTFTPAFSISVTCENDEEVEELYQSLKVGGEVLMPLDSYLFSRRFGWVNDRYGVSWQIQLA
jgi:predicted 3-demethylubiquinone-9 3-methyltransferase (glyoxalase superfamily)